ncbi:MAG: 2-phospho-L-lactate/phosphoenolpyruvate guanylyltransferase [Alphaproteobacteria bacterium]|nr:2-phospho-L-lactate/phosphoenolpyruvate guanylyltransferase [Alphaproteobacteria bacterium]
MDCWAIIPVKPLGAGKSRLAAVLGAEQRAALNKHLFGRVLNATLGVFKPERVAVVTADPLLLPLMRGQGLHALKDMGGGLNAALSLACRYAADRGARAVAVLPSDLPKVTADDVKALVEKLSPAPCCVVAPDHQEQGTNALALAPAEHDFFRFGPDSFQAHLAAAKARGMKVRILRRPGLAHDLDTPEEYRCYAKEQLAQSGALA